MNILVFAEQRENLLHQSVFELITLSRQLSASKITVILIGDDTEAFVKQLQGYGVQEFYLCGDIGLKYYHPVLYIDFITSVVNETKADVIFFSATAMGNDLAPRLAVRLDGALATDCISVERNNTKLTVVRPVFGERLIARMSFRSVPWIVTCKSKIVMSEKSEEYNTPVITKIEMRSKKIEEVVHSISICRNDIDMETSDIVIGGGRGLESSENFLLIEKLATKIGAATGASRPVVDSGWRPYKEQIGQTGRKITPSIYLAAGISGSVQHLAGISSRTFVIAINNDPSSAIFKRANLGIVGNVLEILPELIQACE